MGTLRLKLRRYRWLTPWGNWLLLGEEGRAVICNFRFSSDVIGFLRIERMVILLRVRGGCWILEGQKVGKGLIENVGLLGSGKYTLTVFLMASFSPPSLRGTLGLMSGLAGRTADPSLAAQCRAWQFFRIWPGYLMGLVSHFSDLDYLVFPEPCLLLLRRGSPFLCRV